jgi:nucleotide-binding universal stress UspA family protein
VTGPLEELHYHRLLVAIDGSANGELALRAAVTVALRDRARLTLVCVAPDTSREARSWPLAPVAPVESQLDADEAAQRILREAARRMPPDVSVTTVCRRGSAATQILAQAETEPYDAILMGARGVGRVAALIGSVSHAVLHAARIPVFVAHAPTAAP